MSIEKNLFKRPKTFVVQFLSSFGDDDRYFVHNKAYIISGYDKEDLVEFLETELGGPIEDINHHYDIEWLEMNADGQMKEVVTFYRSIGRDRFDDGSSFLHKLKDIEFVIGTHTGFELLKKRPEDEDHERE